MVSLFNLQTSVHFSPTEFMYPCIVHCCLQSMLCSFFLQNDYFPWVEYFLMHIFVISLFMSLFCPFLTFEEEIFFFKFTFDFIFYNCLLFPSIADFYFNIAFLFSNSFISTSSIYLCLHFNLIPPYDFAVLRLRKGHLTFAII